MVSKLSLLFLLLSLIGCGKADAKDPRLEKIFKDREAKASDGSGTELPIPQKTKQDSDKSTDPGSDDSKPNKKPKASEKTPTTDTSALGKISNIAFFCSKTSSNQLGTSLQKATGVSIKLFNTNGVVIAENGDINNAQTIRTEALNSKSIDLKFSSGVADGLYYVAFCDVVQHALCNIGPDRRGDPISATNSKFATGIVGYADNVSVSSGKIIAVGKTEALLPHPQNNEEKALCDKVN